MGPSVAVNSTPASASASLSTGASASAGSAVPTEISDRPAASRPVRQRRRSHARYAATVSQGKVRLASCRGEAATGTPTRVCIAPDRGPDSSGPPSLADPHSALASCGLGVGHLMTDEKAHVAWRDTSACTGTN